jgi:hypothetical protein
VARAEVDAGFVYATDAALMPGKVKVAFAAPTTTPILYPAAPVAASANPALAQRFVDAQVGGRTRCAARRGFTAAERDTRTERGEAAEHAAAVGIGGKVVGAIGRVVHVVGSSNGRVDGGVMRGGVAQAAAPRDGTQRPVSRMGRCDASVTKMSRTRL